MEHHKFVIIGAGLSGVMAGAVLPKSVVIEKNLESKIPKGFFMAHKPIHFFHPQEFYIRFMDEVGNVEEGNEELATNYEQKIYGKQGKDCSSHIAPTFARGYLPNDGWEKHYKELFDASVVREGNVHTIDLDSRTIEFNEGVDVVKIKFDTLITTIPLPTFLHVAKIPFDNFAENIPFSSDTYEITDRKPGTKECFVVYDGSKEGKIWRTSVLYGHAYVEHNGATEREIKEALECMGVSARWIAHARNYPGKIIVTDEQERQRVLKVLKNYKVIPLGRYACWEKKYYQHNVKETLDDIIKNL